MTCSDTLNFRKLSIIICPEKLINEKPSRVSDYITKSSSTISSVNKMFYKYFSLKSHPTFSILGTAKPYLIVKKLVPRRKLQYFYS